MKRIKTHFMAALLMAGAVLAACSSEENIAVSNIQPEVTTGQYTLTVRASKGSDAAQTRALGLDDTGALNATWTTGDEVGVYNASSTELGTLTATVDAIDAKKCTFSGSLTTVPAVGDELTLKFNSPNYTTQDGTLATIATTYDYATASVTVSAVDAGAKTISASDASFQNQQAIVKFTLKDKGNSDAAISATKLTVGYGASTITVTPALAASELYVAIPARLSRSPLWSAPTPTPTRRLR